ncbi:hypothetical protein FOA52_003294 [Chlamydomonas sp. UWO 241]|nr:hypothetical protein FOA52_003294 [Chlamydomonas sp. UWO 241]
MIWFYQMRGRLELTLGGVYNLLPVVHKYDFPRPIAQLVDFVKDSIGELDHCWDPSDHRAYPSTYVVHWLALAERLQLDELREMCLDRLRGMSRRKRKVALTVYVEVGSGAGATTKHVIREEVKGLGQALCFELLAITAANSDALSDDDDDDDE